MSKNLILSIMNETRQLSNDLNNNFKNYEINTEGEFSGLANIEKVNIGINPTSFTIFDSEFMLRIFATDSRGQIYKYTENEYESNTTLRSIPDMNISFDFTKINVTKFSNLQIISGISNYKFFQDHSYFGQDINFKEINLNIDENYELTDFVYGNNATFFINKKGGIIRKGSINIIKTQYEEGGTILLKDITFQAINLNEKEKELYALDRQNEMQPNNLYIFYLTNDLEFKYKDNKIQYDIVKTNEDIFFNNLIRISDNNLINERKNEFIFVGIKLKDNRIVDNKINLYGGYLFYNSNKTEDTYINSINLNDNIEQFLRIHKEFYNKLDNLDNLNILNELTEIILKNTQINELENFLTNFPNNTDVINEINRLKNSVEKIRSRSVLRHRIAPPKLKLDKLYYEDFGGKEFLNFKNIENNSLYNFIQRSVNKSNINNFRNNPYRLINLNINNKTSEIFVLFLGNILRYPIYNFNPRTNTKRLNSLANFPINKINENLNKLNRNIRILQKRENKINEEILNSRKKNSEMDFKNIKSQLERIDIIEKKNKSLSANINNLKNQEISNDLRFNFWLILIIISIILIIISFIKQDFIPFNILIIYIILITIITIYGNNLI